jgi:GrpB-like predicted nucleotidyltransferase (UPF0157 family)
MGDMAVELVDYDPSWPEQYEQEERRLATVLGPWLDGGIHHIGSTSIPGMLAKPIIDVMAGVGDLDEARAAVPMLAESQYLFWPDDPNEWRLWFLKPEPSHRTHHLHLVESSHPQFAAKLAFRDALRGDRRLRREYARLKRELASAHRHDREAYTAGKSDFVLAVLDGARAQRRADGIES